jgi:hypothetical protein
MCNQLQPQSRTPDRQQLGFFVFLNRENLKEESHEFPPQACHRVKQKLTSAIQKLKLDASVGMFP